MPLPTPCAAPVTITARPANVGGVDCALLGSVMTTSYSQRGGRTRFEGVARWIGSAERTLSEAIPASPDVVRAFYVDLRNIVDVHPLVVSVTPTERVESADGYAQDYRIQDRIAIGPVSKSIEYVAQVMVSASNAVSTEARQFPRVRLLGAVSFDVADDGTMLTERLTITAPRPLLAFTVREAASAHRRMLSGIREHFARVT
jgi:hypothetical protein